MDNNPDYNNKEIRMRTKLWMCVAGIVTLFLLAGILFWQQADRRFEGIKKREPVVELLKNVYITEVTDTYISIFDGENKTFSRAENLKEKAAGADNKLGADNVSGEVPVSITCVPGQIADITLTDGLVSAVAGKDTDKINGKVLRVEPGTSVELENLGTFSFTEDVKLYTLYGPLRTAAYQDIRIGYNFADFVLENGKICAVLLAKEESMEYIRVQIKNSDYAGSYHDVVELSCDTDFVIRYGNAGGGVGSDGGTNTAENIIDSATVGNGTAEELHAAGEIITITADSSYFSAGGDRITIVPTALTGKISLQNVNRSQGVPVYRGTMEILRTESGLAVINEVLLEEYLYAVVPSEMPSGYPIEALKAQAICARTYAYSHMINPGLSQIGAHVDDSTAYQVYNNIVEQNTTTTAVKETAGQLLYADGSLVNTYYYSTSCGFGSDEHAWKSDTAPELSYLSAQSISLDGVAGRESIYTARTMQEEAMFAQFLSYPPETDFEKEEPWYRWNYEVTTLSPEKILSQLQSRYAVSGKLVLTLEDGEYVSKKPEKLGGLQNISILARNEGGAADEVLIEGSEGTYRVISELNIRYVLCDGESKVVRQDGSLIEMKSLLPSAFFVISPIKEEENMVGYKLYGGGFGHGAGMSQNGAKNMAKAGMTAEQILAFFYKESVVEKVE